MHYTAAALTVIAVMDIRLAPCLAGPPTTDRSSGNMLQLLLSPRYGDYEFNWQKMYGSTYRLKGCFGVSTVQLLDACLTF
jgi:hypothetical protein